MTKCEKEGCNMEAVFCRKHTSSNLEEREKEHEKTQGEIMAGG